MKHLVYILLFALNTMSAQDIYYNEDFESITIPNGQTVTSTLPDGWHNHGNLKITHTAVGKNKYLAFYSAVENTIFSAAMPKKLIKSNSLLKLKVAISKKEIQGKLDVVHYKDGYARTVIGTLDFKNILFRDSEFTNVNPTSKFTKEIDLSDYASKEIEIHFEMTAEKKNVLLYLDDLQLVSDSSLSLEESNFTKSVTVYPNPTRNYIHIRHPETVTNYLYNPEGDLITTTNLNSLDMSNLPNGLYFLKTVDASGNHYNHKVIKK